MQPGDETILKITKEIIIKFIESGRVSTTNFDEQFKSIYWTIKSTVVNARIADIDPERPSGARNDDSEEI
ncbi:MAG: conjugal transfer protein TraB [Syntrophobacteraceae bacterium]|nr:conjugal transfer protein TraB [Desulfobacteraceae bacterium]